MTESLAWRGLDQIEVIQEGVRLYCARACKRERAHVRVHIHTNKYLRIHIHTSSLVETQARVHVRT